MTHRILFVCLGNICRSPAAEGVFRKIAVDAGRTMTLDSAGTGGWHAGEPPYGPMQAAAKRRGYELSGLRARQVSVSDFHEFDLILSMDRDNFDDLSAMQPNDGRAVLKNFMDYGPAGSGDLVPDPYYTRDFDGALDLIEAAAKGLMSQLD